MSCLQRLVLRCRVGLEPNVCAIFETCNTGSTGKLTPAVMQGSAYHRRRNKLQICACASSTNKVSRASLLGSMRLSAVLLPGHPALHTSLLICRAGQLQRRATANSRVVAGMPAPASSAFHSKSQRQSEQQQQEQRQQRSRCDTKAHAAAGSATWDHFHDKNSDEAHGSSKEGCNGGGNHGQHSHAGHSQHPHHSHHQGVHRCCGGNHAHSHGHGHQHYSTDAGTPSNPVLSALSKTGLFSLAEHLEHNAVYTVASVSCFVAALLLPYCAAQGLLQAATAALLGKAALGLTYLLSGVPQLAETVGAAAAGKVDTHVLMSLSIIGTLYMGMAQEGALLLLLFRVSHLLEDRLTERAAGSLQRLFDSVPNEASVVEVDEGGAPRAATTQQVPADSVALGQHVLVRPGEQVPLDGVITWGVANLSLQHISGEAQPVKLGPGQEVPAGSLSTDGLLVVRVAATAQNSTPSRIAQMAADAQARRPQLTRWLDRVGEVWSKAVIAATLATAALLPLLGVPFLGDRGALYRAMGVLTAGSPCALALVPLAYACAIAAITSRGILIKSGASLDALAACKTIALDKTGTITTGSMNLAEGFVFNLKPQDSAAVGLPAGSSSSSGEPAGWVHVRALEGLADLCKKVAGGGSVIGTTTGFSASSNGSSHDTQNDKHQLRASSSQPSAAAAAAADGTPAAGIAFDELALKCAVALSRLSTHPVSRAMVDSAPHVGGDVAVLSFEQVPGSGVQGVCRIGESEPVHVRFGAADWINSHITDQGTVSELDVLMKQHTDRPSRATALLSVSQLLPTEEQQQPANAAEQQQQQQHGSLQLLTEQEQPDMAVVLEDASSSKSSSRPASRSSSSSRGAGVSRPASPVRFLGSMDNRDGSTTFSFDEEEAPEHLLPPPAATAPAKPQPSAASRTASGSSDKLQQQQQQPSPGSSVSGSVDLDGSYGPPAQPSHMALLCFEDVIQGGVPATVQQLQSGSWSSSRWRGSGAWLLGSSPAAIEKDVVMLTGDNQRVAQAVAGAVGITDYKAGLKPEDKLAYVTDAAAAAAAAAGPRQGGSGAGGLLMAGDGINDAPALAAAQVGVAIASTPKDMVAAAADIIVLNGQGINNLPWLFRLADRTQTILQQNLALALASVAVATLPTVAGMFPLWLAVTLHEGSTLLVALNSLRLLLEGQSGDKSSSGDSSAKRAAAAQLGHSHHHSGKGLHSH